MRRHAQLLALMLILAAPAVIAPAQDAPAAERERALFQGIARLHRAASEADALALASDLENDPMLGRAEREQMRYEALRVLEQRATMASMPYLEMLRADPPRITEMRVECRHPEPVLRFPYQTEADRLEWLIRSREAATAMTPMDDEALVAMATERLAGEPAGWWVDALLSAVKSRGPAAALLLLERLGPNPAAKSWLVDVYTTAGLAPPADVFARFAEPDALRLLGRADELPADQRDALLAMGSERAGTRSAAVAIAAGDAEATDDLVALLERGAEGAMVAGRDRGAGRTEELAALLARGGEIARLARVALLLQDTPASRAAAEGTTP